MKGSGTPIRRGWSFVGTLFALFLATPLLATCGGDGGAPSAASRAGTEPCSKQATRQAMRAFVRAFNRGAGARLDALFADEPEFQWYSSPAPGRRLRGASMKRSTLVPYFRSRHARGDRMRLTALQLYDDSPGWSNVGFELDRRSDGFREGRWYPTSGKAAAICDGGRAGFIVMSLGGPLPSG